MRCGLCGVYDDGEGHLCMLKAPAPAGPYTEEPPSSASDVDDADDGELEVACRGDEEDTALHMDEVFEMQTRLIEQATRFTEIINKQTKLINHLKGLEEVSPPAKQDDELVKHMEKRRKIEPAQPIVPRNPDVILDFIHEVIVPMHIRRGVFRKIRILISEFCDKYDTWATQKGYSMFHRLEITNYLTDHIRSFRRVRSGKGLTFEFDYAEVTMVDIRRVVNPRSWAIVDSIVKFAKSALIDMKLSIGSVKCSEFLGIYANWCVENGIASTKSPGHFSRIMSEMFPTAYKKSVASDNTVMVSFDHRRGAADFKTIKQDD